MMGIPKQLVVLAAMLAAVLASGCGDSGGDSSGDDSTTCTVGEAPMPCQCAGVAANTFCNNGVRTCNCGGGGGTGAVGGGTGGGTNTGTGGNQGTGGNVGSGGNQGTGGNQSTGGSQSTGGTTAPPGCEGGQTCAENSFVSGVMPGFTFCGAMGGFGHEPPPCGANMDCSAYPGSSCQNLMVIEGCIESCTP